MEGLNQENQESRENGKNVHIKTQFLRHGEKSSFYGDLSEKGIEDAKKYGREFPSSEGGVKGFHSHIKRSKDTLENIIQEVESEKKYKSRPRNELLLNDPGEISWSEESIKKYRELTESHKGDENAALDWYLSYGDKRPDQDTISPKEAATRIARLIEKYTRMVARLKSNSSVDFIHVSHSGTMEPFLQQIIGDEIEENPINPAGKTFLEKLGGVINFLEGFQIDVKSDENDNIMAELTFRGRKFSIDLKKLEEITFYDRDVNNDE